MGVDGTDFGFEALHQSLALVPSGASVLAVTALDMAGTGRAGFEMDRYKAQFEQEADRARVQATEILGDRPHSRREWYGAARKTSCATCAPRTTPPCWRSEGAVAAGSLG